MEFPEKSRSTTDRLFTWDDVRKLLDKESMRRAEYIAKILTGLSKRFGEQVYSEAARVIYQIGYEKGQARAQAMQDEGGENDLESLARLISHETAQLYLGNKVEVQASQMVVMEDYCPLPRKWKEMGLSDSEIVSFCLLFDQVDKGMVEGYNEDFVACLSGCQGLAKDGYCQMVVKQKS
jgi:L-2-amino-thiazoline-4-carboxylic acid hydrolase